MRNRTKALAAVSAAVVVVAGIGLYAQSPPPAPRPARPVPPPAPPNTQVDLTQRTSLQIDVFQVGCAAEALVRLDLGQIESNAESAEQLFAQLGQIGEASLLARISDQVILTEQTKLSSGSKLPIVQDVATSKVGRTTPRINYEQVGFIGKLRGHWRDGQEASWATIDAGLECSSVARSAIDLVPDVKLPSMLEARFDQMLAVRSGEPIVLMSNTFPGPQEESPQLTVFFVRLVATRLGGPGGGGKG